jgi:hypothetical protein
LVGKCCHCRIKWNISGFFLYLVITFLVCVVLWISWQQGNPWNWYQKSHSNKNVNIKFSARVSGIYFIRYTQRRKILKPNNFKIFGSNTSKGPKLDSQNWLWLPTVMLYLRYLCLFAHSGVQHILCLTHPMLPVSLDCPCLIAPSVFPNVYSTRYVPHSNTYDIL